MFDPCEDNWYDNLMLDQDRLNHYTEIDWQIISYIINQYKVGDVIQCPNDLPLQVTRNGIQLAIWYFTNPDDTEPNCPVGDSGEQVECDSGCAIIAEVEAVFDL